MVIAARAGITYEEPPVDITSQGGGSMGGWQYLKTEDTDALDRLGAEGWELVGMVPAVDGRSRLLFKRPQVTFRERVTLEQRQRVFTARGADQEHGGKQKEGTMKRGGILHAGLLALLASTGHTDHITVCDRGFPVPDGPARIDLGLVDDIPTVLDVLKAVLPQWGVDRMVVASEMAEISPHYLAALQIVALGIALEAVPHLEFKQLSLLAKGTIRTGDTVAYSNIILVSG